MNLNLEIILQKKQMKYSEFAALFKAYTSTETFQTFRGFLLYAGLTPSKVSQMHKRIADNDLDAIKIFEVLEAFKMSLEVKMEKYLLYQGNHPDLQLSNRIDYKNIQFLLSKSNPELYGSGSSKVILTKEVVKGEPKTVEINDSGYTMLGGNINADSKKL